MALINDFNLSVTLSNQTSKSKAGFKQNKFSNAIFKRSEKVENRKYNTNWC